MNIRKLLDWRKLLIYSHRWLGIAITVMFLVWTLSGVVLMYYGHPQITTGERLLRLEAIDDSLRELDGRAFGNLAHEVLREFGRCPECRLEPTRGLAASRTE